MSNAACSFGPHSAATVRIPCMKTRYCSVLMHKRRDFVVRSSESMTGTQQRCGLSKLLRNDCLAVHKSATIESTVETNTWEPFQHREAECRLCLECHLQELQQMTAVSVRNTRAQETNRLWMTKNNCAGTRWHAEPRHIPSIHRGIPGAKLATQYGNDCTTSSCNTNETYCSHHAKQTPTDSRQQR